MSLSYENAFLDHLEKDGRTKSKIQDRLDKRLQTKFQNKLHSKAKFEVKQKILKKYRKRWWRLNSGKKKKIKDRFKSENLSYDLITSIKNVTDGTVSEVTQTYNMMKGTSWPSLNIGSSFLEETSQEVKLLHRRRSLDSALLQNASFCTEFPISEIGTEMSGNRGNGNSPFNSSNSCGSPEGLFSLEPTSKLTRIEQTVGPLTACSKCDGELNNNTDQLTKDSVTEMYVCHNTGLDKSVDIKMADGNKQVSANMCKNDSDSDSDDDADDDEDSDDCFRKRASVPTVTKISESPSSAGYAIKCESPIQYVGTNASHNSRKPAPISPVKWQQQFMSFLTTISPVHIEDDHIKDDIADEKPTHCHSPKRKRNRNVRNNLCPCCLGSPAKKLKHIDGKHIHHQTRFTRQQKHFIRDMAHLVALRNKIVKVLQTLFPECVERINGLNPDTESVDDYIEHIIQVIKNPDNVVFNTEQTGSNMDLEDNNIHNDKCRKDPKLSVTLPIFSSEEGNKNEEIPVLEHCMDIGLGKIKGNLSDCSDNEEALTSNTPVLENENKDIIKNGRHESLFSEGDSGIVFDHNESQSEGRASSHYIDDTSGMFHSKCDPPELHSSTDHHAKYLGLDVSYTATNSMESEKIHCRDSHSIIQTDEVDSSSASNVKSLTKTKINMVDLQTENHQTKKVENSSTRKSLFDKLMESPLAATSSERSDPFICLSATINNSAKKPEQSAISPALIESPEIEDSASRGNFSFPDKSRLDSSNDTHISHTRQPNASLDRTANSDDSVVSKVIEVYDVGISLCDKPKFCLKSLQQKVLLLLYWLLPELTLENNYLKSVDNLEYLLDAIIFCNQRPLSIEV